MSIIGIKGLTGGLSNQRLAMLGLMETARSRSVIARFPSQMVDFVPRDHSVEPGRFYFHDLFDVEAFKNAVADEAVSTELADELVPFAQLLPIGVQKCMAAKAGDRAAKFMLGLRASKPLETLSSQIRGSLINDSFMALQLRIERDWGGYLIRLKQEGRIGNEYNTVDPDVIFSKIRSTPQLDRFENVYACCDENDLLQSKSELKRIAKKHSINVVFQSDIPEKIKLPEILILKSMVDFTICEQLPVYIGSTRSTFSRTLYKSAEWRGSRSLQYSFNLQEHALTSQSDSVERSVDPRDS